MSSGIDLLGPASAVGAVSTRPAETRVFGAADTWFAPCSSQSSRDGTQFQAVFLNALLAQLRYALRASGIDLDNDSDAMLWEAIRSLTPSPTLWHYGADTSNAAAGLVAAVKPAVSAYEPFVVYAIKVANDAADGGTRANFGPGLRDVKRADGTPIRKGDYVRGQVITLVDDGERLQLIGLLTQNLPASSSLLFTASGTFTPPPGVQKAFVQVWGAGGGGGGAGSFSASGNGGGPGGYAEGYVNLALGEAVAVTVGAPGAAGAAGGGNGSNGGTSSFGSLISATGGAGGLGSPSGIVVAAAAPGSGFGGTFQWAGVFGQFGYVVGSTYFGGTNGAGYQSSINPPGANSPGGAGAGAGSGGSGASANAPGGAGAAGQIRISY